MTAETRTFVCKGSGADMALIGDGVVDMVFTSPPYFSDDSEADLRQPLREQCDYERVLRDVTEFAMRLRPVFNEIGRVLKPTGILVLQTKHLRYGDWLLPLTDLHTDLCLSAGLRLITKKEWLGSKPKPERRPRFLAQAKRGQLRAWDTETFLVFCKGEIPEPGVSLGEDMLEGSPDDLASPLWRTAPATGRRHPFASPPKVVRRFIQCFSNPGDLVVDPFCGFGTTLVEAKKLGRRAIGFEIVDACVAETEKRLR